MAPPLPLGLTAPAVADPIAQMNYFCSFVNMLENSNAKDENKLKAAQELSENLEVIIGSSEYPQFLNHSIPIFLKILQNGEPQFISDHNIQQVRKLILEMIHRFPTNEKLKSYVPLILSLMLKLLEIENEENVLVCLRIIIELHKHYRPPSLNADIQRFMQFVKGVYSELPSHLNQIFEPRPQIRVKDLSELNLDQILSTTYTITQIHCEKKTPQGSNAPVTYQLFNILPKAMLSLKVLQELPIVMVFLYQLNKPNGELDITDFIPLIMSTITLQPSLKHRNSPQFNKEVFVDFMGAQIKALSFLAYIIRLYQGIVATHSQLMVKGMLGLLTLCPNEVAHLRRELLIAARHILATDLRSNFVQYMEQLFDEDILLGRGCTTHESLRPLAFSTLADLVHHVRTSLSARDLARAVRLFSKNVHDATLPATIQTMSCKLLLNMVDCIRLKADGKASRELLMRILEVFVLKFKMISKMQLPFVQSRNHPPPTMPGFVSLPYLHNPLQPGLIQQAKIKLEAGSIPTGIRTPVPSSPALSIPPESPSSIPPTLPSRAPSTEQNPDKSCFGFPSSHAAGIGAQDFRSLVKTLVFGVKTITWGCAPTKTGVNEGSAAYNSIQFNPSETAVFINLVKWALRALDLYTLSINSPTLPNNLGGTGGAVGGNPQTNAQLLLQQRQAPQAARNKEEKEVLEHFSGVFLMMHTQTFQEIFSATIDYMVEQIYRNPSLQVIPKTFLANLSTSPIFATVLVEYLLERMEEMGSNVERSNLYLGLFKLVFGSVTYFPPENEHMLRPHLHRIVNASMELAMTAKEPYNYFLLLRGLFRSIGGGSHELLYKEFLPLLPNLLEGLNRLQSGLHKQHMKILFVELCLTVPVRLSSLLPYLPMLMDPLVSALNGSDTLISQGLRTLELCVDNLQPDFLYEHIQPVRAELMQALWRTLRNPDTVAHVAFRVLGKFGGGNRKMMIEPQKLEYKEHEGTGPAVRAYFQDHRTPVDFPVDKIIEMSFTALKSSTTKPFYRQQCWEVVRCYLSACLGSGDDQDNLLKLLSHPDFREREIPTLSGGIASLLVQRNNNEGQDEVARKTHQTALTSMFVAAAIKELRHSVLNTMICLVRHYTMVAVAQQSGPLPLPHPKAPGVQELDPLVLIDALAVIMGHEEKELCKPGHVALVLIEQTATTILGSSERACQLPLMEYLSERMTALCYERAWYAKLGGCIAIKFFVDKMAQRWVFGHMFVFLKAFMFVLMDLTGEVSSGAIDMAKANLENMLRVCAVPLDSSVVGASLVLAQNKAISEVVTELVRQITSPHTVVREQAMQSLRLIAELQNRTVTDVMLPHREVLVDVIPPKKHRLRLRHQPANAQIGLMDGNTFCTTLQPKLFTIDLSIEEHMNFVSELLSLCKDDALGNLPCYKNVPDLIPIRCSALGALAACHYITDVKYREEILDTLFAALEKPNSELQKTAYECIKRFREGYPMDEQLVYDKVKPLFKQPLKENMSLSAYKRLSYLAQLFPNIFKEDICKQLLQHVKTLLELAQENSSANYPPYTKNSEIEQKIVLIIGIFHQVTNGAPHFLDLLHIQNNVLFEPSSPYREPLIKYLLRTPVELINHILQMDRMKDPQWTRFLFHLLKHKDGLPFRDAVHALTDKKILPLILSATKSTLYPEYQINDLYEIQHVCMKMITILIKHDDLWIASQTSLIDAIKLIWNSEEYQIRMNGKKNCDADFSHWKEPKLIVKILLKYFCYHPNEIDLLFQLLCVFVIRFIPDFQFLRDFLENTVCVLYDYNWKRAAFFKFVEHFSSNLMTQELKAKILQMIIIPCFAKSFENNEGQYLIGSTPKPFEDNSTNIVSVFIQKVIDPDNPFGCSDSVRIALLQLSCLLVEQAASHIHDANTKQQGDKLRRLMQFAWPCLLAKNCVDPTTRYHGHLLLSHIIAKFAIHKRIVLQVFHSLLKAYAIEARSVVRQALEILTPAMPVRMEEGNTMLTHWTKKIIVDEGHSMPQLFHILQLIVRHYKVYYPVRHHLVQHMISSIQRLGFSPAASLEHRKLAVELAEVVIKWDLQRIREEGEPEASTSNANNKRSAVDDGGAPDPKRPATDHGSPPSRGDATATLPLERKHTDAVLNFLLRLACQVNELNPQNQSGGSGLAPSSLASPGELLSRRCVALIRTALKPDVWPPITALEAPWLDKVLSSVESPAANLGNVCTGLELLTHLLSVLQRDHILTTIRPLQRGLCACISLNDSKVIRLVHGLLLKLMSSYPPESTGSQSGSRYEELEPIYTKVAKVIADGLKLYEESKTPAAATLFSSFMLLKAACATTPSYIDRSISPFMRVLHRMAEEHLCADKDSGSSISDLLILGLDLVKTRVVVMGVEMRKIFIGNVLVSLIEKTPDIKIMKAITKMLEEWMKHKNPITLSQAPSLREKSILLVKMMQYVEKRFPDDIELNSQFLELINYVYRDEQLKNTELPCKLEPAFLSGLRCSQPHIRAKFFSAFDQSIRRRLHDRLLYITCSQAWDAMGSHYWIKQCVELLLVTTVPGNPIQMSEERNLLPAISSVIHRACAEDRKRYEDYAMIKLEVKEEETSSGLISTNQSDVMDLDLVGVSSDVKPVLETPKLSSSKSSLPEIIVAQADFLKEARTVRTEQLLIAAAQLCHMDTSLAENVWLELFPKLWRILDNNQRNTLSLEIIPFVCSGAHVIQKDCHPSAINTFVEALTHCDPPVPIKPCIMKYLGKSHNLWHRMTLNLEQMSIKESGKNKIKQEFSDCYDFEPDDSGQMDILNSLSDMYSLLCEEDMWSGLWQKHAHYKETTIAIAYEQQGFFEQAQGTYEVAMSRHIQDCASGPTGFNSLREAQLWDKHWIRCARELNQWDLLLNYGRSRSEKNPFLVLESAWRVPQWGLMKEALAQTEYSCPKEMLWQVNLYRSYLAICQPEDQTDKRRLHLKMVDRYVEACGSLCMREWRRLPRIVSHVHLPLLQAAQQIMELQEAGNIHQGLLGDGGSQNDMNAIVKTWRNRLPVMADDMSHWSDIFTWRQHHYQHIVNHYEQKTESAGGAGTPTAITSGSKHTGMLGVHASAETLIHFAKIARKHNLPDVCLDSLSRIYTIPSVPIVDCFQKIRQQVKCYLQMASYNSKAELQGGLEVIESTQLQYFKTSGNEMVAELYSLKGMLLAQLGRSEEANKAFSFAINLHDKLVKAWALWGDYLESVYSQDPQRNMKIGESAITCYLHACRNQNESKSRKYLAKVLWMMAQDDASGVLMAAVDKYAGNIPLLLWLPWIPQLVVFLVQYNNTVIMNLLTQIGRMFPQAVYFPNRMMYFTLKIEEREWHKVNNPYSSTGSNSSQQPQGSSEGIKITPPIWRCSRIMQMQKEIHPMVLTSLEGIIDQMDWFRENCYEEVLRHLRQGLAKCYAMAFENRGAVGKARITPHIVNFVEKLAVTFGTGIEHISSSVHAKFPTAASESLARRVEATKQDPVFQKMKDQFKRDIDFNQPNAMRLHNLIAKFKKWIRILEAKTKLLPKSFLIEEKCRFLSNFSLKTAEVELPGEFLLPRNSHYYVRIARFMPRVEIAQKHNAAARRLFIRGHNGKVYPYLVVNSLCFGDARREERVLQLLRMLNHYLGKQKETSRRFLHYTIPKVVAISPQIRLVEDNPASLSLLDIYKKGCSTTLGIDHEDPVTRYYERLASIQARGAQIGHEVLRDVLQEVQCAMAPKTLLRDWALRTFPGATDYWTFRKMFTLQLSLSCFAEYVLHLTRLNPDMMYIHKDSGLMNIAYYKFDIDDTNCELLGNRPVPFRLTPNIVEFVSNFGIIGPLTASMIAVARCLTHPTFKVQTILRTILRDEIITAYKKREDNKIMQEKNKNMADDSVPSNQPENTSENSTKDSEQYILLTVEVVKSITARLNSLATYEGVDSKVSTLVTAASSINNLCRMDPAWHPWL